MNDRRQVHREVQAKAKRVLLDLASTLAPGDTENSIAARAVGLLEQLGLKETWYHNCPALVLLGSRSALSVSGRHYTPGSEPVGNFNLVTVDLSPCQGDVWGDCARSFCIEDGRTVAEPRDAEFIGGILTERLLHDRLISVATPAMAFSVLHSAIDRYLSEWGYENLDKGGNFGHSIERRPDDRRYIAEGNDSALGDVEYFTFEPHIRHRSGRWGFKHEEIYYFDSDGRACAL